MFDDVNVDINTYFEYVDKIIENDANVSYSDKVFYRNQISIFKISNISPKISDIKNSTSEFINIDINEINSDVELYYLFEYLSKRFFKLLNYFAWRKRVKYGIIK
jgi:hypothetical protein